MSDQHDLRPWYSWLPLPGLILGMPFAFIAFCGNQWQAEHSTFATLAKHKRKPQLHTWLDGKRTRLAATSWLSWPPLEFAHCDLQPTPQPRYAICFDAIQDKATLVRADIEQLVQTGLLGRTSVRGRWLQDGHRYLWGDQLIETKPQLMVSTLPAPFQDLELAASERPKLVSLSTDQEYALWQDRRTQPDGAVVFAVTRIADGREVSSLTINDPESLSKLHDPKAEWPLTQQIVWWTDLRHRQRVMLRTEVPRDHQPIDEQVAKP